MSYKNAKDILPPKLLEELQNYVQGETIYIPQKENIRANWGRKSGTREVISFRNKEIFQKYNEGLTIEELTELFCLSHESIRKIIYKLKR
ncbi:MAG: hypothetical protein LRY71_00425 [Bacillaceae bacterium]|nr:hypothetical protein [Bacillaceae bacterium]